MGTCNKALLSYGIIIPGPKAVAFLNALRKLPPPPKKSTEWDTDEIEDPKAWEHEYDEELGKRIESQFVAAGFDWEELELQTLGSFEEPEGVAVFFNGLYGKKENCCANGLEVEFWDTEAPRLQAMGRRRVMGPAKKAFTQLADLLSFKEAGVKVDPDWLHAVSVS